MNAAEWAETFWEYGAHWNECPVGDLADGGVWYGSPFAIHSDPACTDRTGECDCDVTENKEKIRADCNCSLGVILSLRERLAEAVRLMNIAMCVEDPDEYVDDFAAFLAKEKEKG